MTEPTYELLVQAVTEANNRYRLIDWSDYSAMTDPPHAVQDTSDKSLVMRSESRKEAVEEWLRLRRDYVETHLSVRPLSSHPALAEVVDGLLSNGAR